MIVVWRAFMLYYVLLEGKLAETCLVWRQVVFVQKKRRVDRFGRQHINHC
jgi:hypothetical protein